MSYTLLDDGESEHESGFLVGKVSKQYSWLPCFACQKVWSDKNLIPDGFLAEIVLIRTKFHTGEIFVRNCAPNVMHKFCGMTTVACSSYSFDNALQYCKRN